MTPLTLSAVLLTLIAINIVLMLMHVRSVNAQMRRRQNLQDLARMHVVSREESA